MMPWRNVLEEHLVSFSAVHEQNNDSVRAKICASQSGGFQDKSGAFRAIQFCFLE